MQFIVRRTYISVYILVVFMKVRMYLTPKCILCKLFQVIILKSKLPNPPLVILRKGFSTLVLLMLWTKLFFVVRCVLCILG